VWKGLAGDIRPALKPPRTETFCLPPTAVDLNTGLELKPIQNQTGPPEQATLLLIQSLCLIPGTKKNRASEDAPL
jgi:hypothetical protein